MNNNITTKIEEITPSIAHEYLAHNIANRKIRDHIVELYADQMRKGLWRLSNDTLCFTRSGKLINGQHRLTAVCRSGCKIPFVVARGFDEEDIMAMDNGVARSAGDNLHLQDVENANTVSGIVKRRLVLSRHCTAMNKTDTNGMNSSNNKVLNSAVNDEYFAHAELYQNVVKMAKVCYGKLRLLVLSEIGGIAAHLILDLGHKEYETNSFFREFCGLDKETNNAISILRTKLMNDKLSKTKMSAVMKQKLIIKTWNAYITGKSIKVLAYNEANDKDLWFE